MSTATPSVTGPLSYNIGQSSGSITSPSLTPAKTYIVSYWTKNTTAYTVAGTISGYPKQGPQVNGWTYFEHAVTSQNSITINGTGYIDELRLYPSGAQMTTSTYDPLIGTTSQCDASNKLIYYEYDAIGRLKLIKDQYGNIIKRYDYQFKVQN